MTTRQQFLDDLVLHLKGFTQRLKETGMTLEDAIMACTPGVEWFHNGEADPNDVESATDLVANLDGLLAEVEQDTKSILDLACSRVESERRP